MDATELYRLGACQPALDWLGERTVEDAWATCDRGDWMYWLLAKIGMWRKSLMHPAQTEYLLAIGSGKSLQVYADAIRRIFPTFPTP